MCQLLLAAGLKPAVLDIESYASRLAMQRLTDALPGQGKDALVALFEIGAENTSLKVLRDNELLYDRDQAFGGAQLTQLISRQYGFSFEEAEQKKLSGDLPEDYQSSLLSPFVDSLSQEIGRALQYFFTSTPHHKVHYVMLAGGTATLPGLKDRVTELESKLKSAESKAAAPAAAPVSGARVNFDALKPNGVNHVYGTGTTDSEGNASASFVSGTGPSSIGTYQLTATAWATREPL